MLLNNPRSLLINFWQLFLIERPDGRRIFRHSSLKAENVTLVSPRSDDRYILRGTKPGCSLGLDLRPLVSAISVFFHSPKFTYRLRPIIRTQRRVMV